MEEKNQKKLVKKLDKKELDKVLKLHKMWLNGDADGQKANLRWAYLYRADLSRANLRGANLCEADLHEADLRKTDLRGADLDFSVFPLWCGSFGIKDDGRLAKQLLGHVARLNISDKALAKWIRAIPKEYKNDLCKRHNIKKV